MSTAPSYLDGGFAALAHRGFSLDGLENSMAAFAAARDLGFRYVETDAHATADGVAVACHDPLLDRTTDRVGAIADLPWSEVRRARIGGVEPMPSLEDLLGAWPDLRVNIDVKAPSAPAAVAAAIEHTGAHDRVCVASFSAARRRETLAFLSRPVTTSAGTSEVIAAVAAARVGFGTGRALRAVDCVQIPWRSGAVTVATGRFVTALHARGRAVHVWTINTPEEMNALIDLGVDGIVTDRADVLKSVLIKRRIWR